MSIFGLIIRGNLADDTSESGLDEQAKYLLDFEKSMIKRWNR